MSIYRRVLNYYRPFIPQSILGILFSLVGIGLNLLKPWPFKIIVDNVLGNRRFSDVSSYWTMEPKPHAILLLCASLVVLQILWGITNWLTNYIFVKIGLRALLKIRTDIYS